MSAAQFLAAFPQTNQDGNFNDSPGWMITTPSGVVIILTDGGDVPHPDTTEVELGRYYPNGDPLDDVDLLNWDEAIYYVQRAILDEEQRSHDPRR